MKVSFSPPDITDLEIEEVIHVLQSGWITTGPKTKEFEKKLLTIVKSKMLFVLILLQHVWK